MNIAVQQALKEEFDRLRGRCMGLIESWGLDPQQEAGCKSTLKALSYDAQRRINDLVDDDDVAVALSEAFMSLKELQRCQAILDKKDGSVDASSFVDMRLAGVEEQIAELKHLLDTQRRLRRA